MNAFSESNQAKVSIIILNWNGLDDTIECLQSLKKITYPNYELILVDNGSAGNDVQVLKDRFANSIHIIENDKNYGFSEGNNIGIRYALSGEAKYVLLLNNDTTVAPDFLSELLNVAEMDPKIGLIGPKIHFYHEPNRIYFAGGKISFLSRSSSRGWNTIDQGQFDKVDRVDFISGCCMLIKKSVFDSIGLLDPIYFFSLEDVDLSLRAVQAGFSIVFVPNSKIWHKAYRSGIKNPRIPYYTARNAVILARRHFLVFRKAAVRAVIVTMIELVIFAIRARNLNIFLMMVNGLRDGLTTNLKLSRVRRIT